MSTFEKKFKEEYEINPFTSAIEPVFSGDKIYSTIYEQEDDEFTTPFKPLDIIKSSCMYFGVSYEGRKVGTTHLTNFTHKVPIAVDSANTLFFFPTHSPENNRCIWIASKHILRYERLDANNTLVLFQDKRTIEVPISYTSFGNQVKRTAVLQAMLLQRMEELKKVPSYFDHEDRYEKAYETMNYYRNKKRKYD